MRFHNIINRFRGFLLLGFCLLVTAGYGQIIPRSSIPTPGGTSVNSFTGNLHYFRTDLFIPGRGPSLEISFSYNSRNGGRNLGYGVGWMFNYDMCYEVDTSGMIVMDKYGHRDLYTLNGSTYESPIGVYSTFEEYQLGKFRLRTLEGMYYYFDDANHKKVTKIEDPNGNALTLDYAAGQLSKATDASGRELAFEWAGTYLISVTDANEIPARTLLYDYDGLGNLTGMTNLVGDQMTFGYGQENRMVTMTDFNSNNINITYHQDGSTSEIISCLTYHSFTYNKFSRKTYVAERNQSGNQRATFSFDEQGRLSAQKGNCCGYEMAVTYDSDNNVNTLTDANGGVYAFGYDNRGNIIQRTDPIGNTTTYTYENTYNNLTQMQDPNGNITQYQYDANDNLTAINRPLGISNSFTYDQYGNRTSRTDGNGNQWTYTHDNNGYVTSAADPATYTSNHVFDNRGNLLSLENAKGNTFTYDYDDLDRLTLLTDPLGNTTQLQYDGNGNVVNATNRRGYSSTYEYDALDRLIKTTDPLGHSETRRYDASGNLIASTDKNGNKTRFAYDKLNRLVKFINAENEQVSYDYDNNGNILFTTMPNGNVISYTYDAANRILEKADDISTIVTYVYDNNSNITASTDGKGNTSTYEYDALDRLTKLSDAFNNELTYQFDNNSNLTSATDRNNKTSTYQYDVRNLLTLYTDALGNEEQYNYDAIRLKSSVTDDNGQTTSYTYNELNWTTAQAFADGTTRTYQYDDEGNIVTRTDNAGQVTAYTYDPLNRMLTRDYSGTNDDVFTYDAGGRVTQAANQHAIINMAYDRVNRMVSETLNGKTTAIAHSATNANQVIQYPGGRTIDYAYDARYRIQNISELMNPIANYQYNEVNRMTAKNYGNGTSSFYAYDNNNRLSEIQHLATANFEHLKYNYKDNDDKASIENLINGQFSKQFTYDNENRLTAYKRGQLAGGVISNPLEQIGYAYDGVGNRTTATVNGAAINYAVNVMNGYASSTQGGATTNYTYDGNGNQENTITHQFEFDEENRVISVDNGSTATYKYDPLNRRIQKATPTDTINYYYHKLRVIEERNENDQTLATYVYGDFLDDVLQMERGGAKYYYHKDGMSSTTSLTDANANVVERYDYDAFGNVTYLDADYNVIANSVAGNEYLYTGQRLDAETGLYYYKNRYYDASTGRFIQRDPMGYIDGLNMYAYADNSPSNYMDPLGLSIKDFFCNPWIRGLQKGLDVAGFIPGLGEFADGLNAAIYLGQGDWKNAAISGLSLLPGGDAAKGMRYADDVLGAAAGATKLADKANDTRKAADRANDASKAAKKANDTRKRGPDGKPYPIGKRDHSSSRKEAREKAKKESGGHKPIGPEDHGHGPHYHPRDPKNPGTDKKPNRHPTKGHDHYYFPKKKF